MTAPLPSNAQSSRSMEAKSESTTSAMSTMSQEKKWSRDWTPSLILQRRKEWLRLGFKAKGRRQPREMQEVRRWVVAVGSPPAPNHPSPAKVFSCFHRKNRHIGSYSTVYTIESATELPTLRLQSMQMRSPWDAVFYKEPFHPWYYTKGLWIGLKVAPHFALGLKRFNHIRESGQLARWQGLTVYHFFNSTKTRDVRFYYQFDEEGACTFYIRNFARVHGNKWLPLNGFSFREADWNFVYDPALRGCRWLKGAYRARKYRAMLVPPTMDSLQEVVTELRELEYELTLEGLGPDTATTILGPNDSAGEC